MKYWRKKALEVNQGAKRNMILSFSELQDLFSSRNHSDGDFNEAMEVVSDTYFKAPA